MRNHLINISICTVAILVFTLLFGYTRSAFGELNNTDIYHCSAKLLGSEFTVDCGTAEDCGSQEAEDAELVKSYIENSMADSEMSCNVSVDYADRCIICKVMMDGTTQALQDGNDEKWEEITKTATETSAGWSDTIRKAGLDDWHFSLVILNDRSTKKALLISTDGRIVYDCQKDSELNIV